MHTDLTDLTLSLRRGAHGGTRDFFEHEIRRRPTDRREVITRMTRIFFAHGGAERNFDFWMLNVELLRLAAMWNWPMMNFDALTRCFEHEIFEHGCHHEFFWTRITRMTRIFFGTRISQITRIFVRDGALTVFWTRIFFEHGSYSHFCFHSIFCKKALGM